MTASAPNAKPADGIEPLSAQLTISLPPSMLDRVIAEAKQSGHSVAREIRNAINAWHGTETGE